MGEGGLRSRCGRDGGGGGRSGGRRIGRGGLGDRGRSGLRLRGSRRLVRHYLREMSASKG